MNNLNPDFQKSIQATYQFEKHQEVRFDVLDDDGSGSFDVVGTILTSMGDIMGARAQTFTGDLTKGT